MVLRQESKQSKEERDGDESCRQDDLSQNAFTVSSRVMKVTKQKSTELLPIEGSTSKSAGTSASVRTCESKFLNVR